MTSDDYLFTKLGLINTRSAPNQIPGTAAQRSSSSQYSALPSTAHTTTASSGASVFTYTQLHETKKEDLQLFNSKYSTWQGLYFFNVCVLKLMEWS